MDEPGSSGLSSGGPLFGLLDSTVPSSEDYPARALTALAPQLPADQLAKALDAARQISDEDRRAPVLTALAGPIADLPFLLASTLLQEVLPVLAVGGTNSWQIFDFSWHNLWEL